MVSWEYLSRSFLVKIIPSISGILRSLITTSGSIPSTFSKASWARVKGYRIAGKTGTASIPIAGHYDPNQTIASFVGFAPANDPKFTMLVILNRPTTSIYGSETAAPVFFDIAKSILTYYGISPQGE